MDTAVYLFFMLASVLFLRAITWHKTSDAIGLLLCVVLLLLSKTQHAILGVWIAPLLAFSFWNSRRRFAIAASVIVAVAAAVSATSAPFDYAAHGNYSVIFTGLLPRSTNVDADLTALGLDSTYKHFIGTHAYSAESGMNDPAFVRTFIERTSYPRLGWFLATHPRDAYRVLAESLGEGGRQRPPMGNFDQRSGLPAATESQTFAFWSDAKRKLFHGHGTRYLMCFVFMAALICAMARRKTLPRELAAGLYAIAGMGLTEMLVASFADVIEVTRHFFIANTILDLEVLIVLAVLRGGRRVI